MRLFISYENARSSLGKLRIRQEIDEGVQVNPEECCTLFLDWLLAQAVAGAGVLPAAESVAAEALREATSDRAQAIETIIWWRTGHAAGVGVLAALPVGVLSIAGISTSLAATYLLGANTAAAIAIVQGYDVNSEAVRSLILLTLLGGSATQMLKKAGLEVSERVSVHLLNQLPAHLLRQINQHLGYRLFTVGTQKGVFSVTTLVPFISGVVGGAIDAAYVYQCAQVAKQVFERPVAEEPTSV